METSAVASAVFCGYLCSTSATCQLFCFNEFTESCVLFSAVNLRGASSQLGNRFYQIMPIECRGGRDEWFPGPQLCLWVHTASLPYHQAESTCQAHGKQVMGVEDSAKNSLTREIMMLTNARYNFVYSNRVTPTTYQWANGQVVNQFWCGIQPQEYHACIGMDLDMGSYCPSGGLDDIPCTDYRPFVCV